jgi:hypothetical protein
MTVQITLELGPGALDAIAKMRAQREVVLAGLLDGARRGAAKIQQRFVKNLAGVEVNVRSGTLSRSAKVETRIDERGLPVVAVGYVKGLADPYAAVIELGTQGKGGELPDIKPKQAKALAVPIGRALDNRGIPIFSGPKDPALEGRLFFVDRSERGKAPLLAMSEGDTVVPMFVLLTRVAIAPRRPARKAIEDSREDFASELTKGVARAERRASQRENGASAP